MATANIEISPYLYQFLVDKYGPEPIQFPQNSMFMRHIAEGCTPPPIGSCLYGWQEKAKACAASKVLICVQLPPDVFRCGQTHEVGYGWHLNYDACRSFRKTADNMFWGDLLSFLQDYKRQRIYNNECYTRKSGILEFMSYHGINEAHLETICRQDRRRKQESNAEAAISKSRQKRNLKDLNGIVNYN